MAPNGKKRKKKKRCSLLKDYKAFCLSKVFFFFLIEFEKIHQIQIIKLTSLKNACDYHVDFSFSRAFLIEHVIFTSILNTYQFNQLYFKKLLKFQRKTLTYMFLLQPFSLLGFCRVSGARPPGGSNSDFRERK